MVRIFGAGGRFNFFVRHRYAAVCSEAPNFLGVPFYVKW